MTALDFTTMRRAAEKATEQRTHTRDPNGPALQCPRCGGLHYICSTAEERQAEQLFRDVCTAANVIALDDARLAAEAEVERLRADLAKMGGGR